eukprot:CCRYP_021113-RB/>CCRYP_021113-RB protein AED:0.44 eAED:0.68 QI:175/0/0.5/1/0/0/2/0/62
MKTRTCTTLSVRDSKCPAYGRCISRPNRRTPWLFMHSSLRKIFLVSAQPAQVSVTCWLTGTF